jgi:hypothetical protein
MFVCAWISGITDFRRFFLSESSFKTGFKGNRDLKERGFWARSCLPCDFEQIGR